MGIDTYFQRLHLLLIKLISMKGLIAITATVFLVDGTIGESTWWMAMAAMVATRAYEKKVHKNAGGH